MNESHWGRAARTLLAGLVLTAVIGCTDERREVVVYCALDREYSEPILDEFEKRTGISVRHEFDVEKTKTVGLVKRLEEEGGTRVRCDVFWNNEILHTLRLKEQGLLAPYPTEAAEELPTDFVDPEGYWYGFAARARVLIVNTEEMPDPSQRPSSFRDLVDPRFKGRACMARPITGTTLTHAAVLYSNLGRDETNAFFDAARANDVSFLAGNAHVMRQVRDGNFAFGFTDTDDFNVARVDSYPVVAVYPDAEEGQVGTLLIPNTVAILRDAPHREEAEMLVDFLLDPSVERALAFAASAQIPLRADVDAPDNVRRVGSFVTMEVDFEAAARAHDQYAEDLTERFLTD